MGMSATQVDELQQRIAHTVATWLADQGGGMVQEGVTVLTFIDAHGKQRWAIIDFDVEQRVTTTLGLLDFAKLNSEALALEILGCDHDDEEDPS